MSSKITKRDIAVSVFILIILVVVSTLVNISVAYVKDNMHTERSSVVVSMELVDKGTDDRIVVGLDEHYIVKLKFKDSMFILKSKDIYSYVDIGENIAVLMTSNKKNGVAYKITVEPVEEDK